MKEPLNAKVAKQAKKKEKPLNFFDDPQKTFSAMKQDTGLKGPMPNAFYAKMARPTIEKFYGKDAGTKPETVKRLQNMTTKPDARGARGY